MQHLRNHIILLQFLTIFVQRILGQGVVTIRFCAPEDVYDYCLQMSTALGSVQCVKARDKFECMYLISRDEADILNVEPEDLYLAGRLFNLDPFAMEVEDLYTYKYKSAVLIPKSSEISSLTDLRGKKSCHTSIGEAAGWNIPIGLLLANNIITPDCRGELFSAENFFSQSCAAGRWSKDPVVDELLKKRHPKLCELCKKPSTCTSTDEYAGVSGAVKCLVEGQADVAFTTVEGAINFFNNNRHHFRANYQFLCLDGRRMDVDINSCSWASKPTNSFVIRRPKAVSSRELYAAYLHQMLFRPARKPLWFTKFFVSGSNVTEIRPIASNQQSWDKYLGNYVASIEQPLPGCERRNVTFCVSSPAALSKCLDMQKVAYTRRIRPDIRCYNPGDSRLACIEAIKSGKADVVSLDAGELYTASRYHDLIPIAEERNTYSDVASYAVAVVKIPSDVSSLAMLENMTSCHSGYGTIEGWVAPVGALIEEGVLEKYECDRARQVGEFFLGSCVPGAADYENHLNATEVLQLCKQCVGDARGERVCSLRGDRYTGNEGAFRCLVEGRGDVAFVNHLTPLKYTDGRSLEFWTRDLRSDDFRLICRQGGQGFLKDFERCNLAKIPSNFIAMAGNASEDEYIDNLRVITDLVEELARKSENSFKIFGAYYGVSDLIFSDTTTSIVALAVNTDYRQALGEYHLILEDMDPEVCGSASRLVSNISLFSVIFVTLYLNALNLR
ncbi:transferrin-like protein [Dinothrombium tinctorium]|uniref:Transferrin-like protein n=1 Tax=Dinothrombium tinctorium TaxID=1965070 RepID=A0A3S3QT36_9ACAR|nr:transferrin-like protein [Dinothrombium tinctorium]